MKKINYPNIHKEKMAAGCYILYNSNKKPIYTGVSHHIKERLFALLYGRADYATVRTKKELRKKAKYYVVDYGNMARSRKKEKRRKKTLKYNVL